MFVVKRRKMYLTVIQIMAFTLGCGDTGVRLDYLSIIASSVNSLAKMAAIHVHMEEVRLIFDSILNDWSANTDKSLQNIMIRFAKTGRSAFIFQISFLTLVIALMTIDALPFLMPSLDETPWDNVTEIVPAQRELPMRTGCIFGLCRDSIYAFMYIYEVYSFMMCGCASIGTDVYLFCLMMHICGQLEILRLDVKEIFKTGEAPQEKHFAITRFIQRHSRLLELIQVLQRTCSLMLVVHILMIAALYLMHVIRILIAVNRGDTEDATRAAFAFSIIMLQLYLFSYASDRMSQQSEFIIDVLYESNWYEISPKLRKDICFMMMRAKKPCYLNAGEFYFMNVENFKNTLKASFSYFSILRVMFIEDGNT